MLAASLEGMRHNERLANAGIVAVERAKGLAAKEGRRGAPRRIEGSGHLQMVRTTDWNV